MDLSTITRAKTLLQSGGASPGTDLDTLLTQVVTAYSQGFEKYLDRHAQTAARTEQYDIEPGQGWVALKGYPVSSVTSVKNDWEREFGSSTLVDASSYYVDLARGTIEFPHYEPVAGPGVLQVVYTGGMAADTTAFLTAFPAIGLALDLQVAYAIQRRKELGAAGVGTGQGSVNFTAEYALLAEVKQTLACFRRVA